MASEHAISTPRLGPTPGGVGHGSQMVPLGDGFLAVWGGGTNLLAIRIDPNGRPRDAESFVVFHSPTDAFIFSFHVATDGTSAFVLSTTNGEDSWHFRLDRVDADGTVTNLSANLLNVPGFGPIAAMAANSGKVMILTLNDGKPLMMTIVDRSGTVLQSGVPLVSSGYFYSLDVEAAGDGFLLTWIDGAGLTRVLGLNLSDIGASRSVSPFVADTDGLAYVPSVAGDGAHAIVVWTRWQIGQETAELRARPVSNSGSPLGEGAVALGKFKPLSSPRVVPAADGYQIVFLDLAPDGGAQVTTVRVAFDGKLNSVARTPSGFANPYVDSRSPPVFYIDSLLAARNGASVAVMWGERGYQPPDVAELVVAPLQPDGSVGPTSLLSKSLPRQHVRKLLPVNGVVAGVWTEEAPNKRVVVGRFTPAGVPLDGAGVRLSESIYDQLNSAAATDGERLFIVWTEGNRPGVLRNALYGAFVPLTGPLIASSSRLLTIDVAPSYSSGHGDDALAVAWNGSTFTVAFGHFDRQDNDRLDLAALRVDRLGNVVDPAPVSLTHGSGDARSEAANPRISWNGNSYLVMWQRRVMAVNSESGQSYSVDDLRAQRLSASLVADGAEIPLDTPVDSLVDADGSAEYPDLALSNGVWLASWLSERFHYSGRTETTYVRIDANGRIDKANRVVPGASSAPLVAAAADGWMVMTGDAVLSFAKIGLDGTVSPVWTTPSNQRTAEAFAVASHPLVAYKRTTDAYLAYIDVIASADHRRSAGR